MDAGEHRAARPTTDGARDRVRSARVGALYRAVAPPVLGAAAASVIVAAVCIGSGAAAPARAAAWSTCVCACAGGHLLLRRWRTGAPDGDWRPWGRRFAALALAEGLLWGWATLGLAAPGFHAEQVIVVLTAYALGVGAIAAFGSHLPAVWCFFPPATVPFAVASLLVGDAQSRAVGLMAVFYIAVMAALARRTNAEFSEALRLRFEMADLAQALAVQKDIAEAASLAKSRFLAAASHDLRQPVHALTMYLGALRTAEMAAPARTLLGHVEASVATLDGLFSALLDISRLDAAVVVAEPAAFALQPMLARICRDHAGEAAAKGVSLRLVACGLTVFTDPVLFERILRNLVANGVRHTGHGRVLVGCRRAGGAVRVEVWDTGPGIPPSLQERVFEEFFQVGNAARDRAQGLGLGLAIVRRLARLLGAELGLRSTEGRGTVFTVAVPRHDHPPDAAAAESGYPAPVAVSGRGLVLVIDDEPAVLHAVAALLAAAGYDVVAAASGAAMLERLADCPVRPRLLLCDYRLRDGEDGLATIERLQSEYNDELPAILVTGDTAPGRLAEAAASGLTVLHKPVGHERLLAAIAQALDLSPATAPAPPPPASG